VEETLDTIGEETKIPAQQVAAAQKVLVP